MEPIQTTRAVSIRVVALTSEGLATMPCLACGAPLDVCQPDPNLPDRFLSTCPDCLAWFLVETSSDQGTAWVASLSSLVGMDQPGERRSPNH